MYRFLFIVLIISSCSTEAVKIKVDNGLSGKIKSFLVRTELDSKNAGSIIEKHKIIQQLTHLRRMNNGGKKFYLLEKENITEMINAVTVGVYDDYVLINKHGRLIYSRSNDDLFGVDIKHGFEDSPLYRLFLSSKNRIHFHDISPMSSQRHGANLYVSVPVFVQNNFHGILILTINYKKLNEYSGIKFQIIDDRGIIRVSQEYSNIYKGYDQFAQVKGNAGSFRFGGKTTYYDHLKYRDLSWYLLTSK